MSENDNQNVGNENQQTGSGSTGQKAPDWNEFVTLMNSLPESIAKSVKEAVGTPKPPEGQGNATNDDSGKSKENHRSDDGNSTGGNRGGSNTAQPGKESGSVSERFASWWTK